MDQGRLTEFEAFLFSEKDESLESTLVHSDNEAVWEQPRSGLQVSDEVKRMHTFTKSEISKFQNRF